MRTLKVLVAAQLLVTGVLIWRVTALESSLAALAPTAPMTAETSPRYLPATSATSSDSSLREADLRQIIREELLAAQSSGSRGQATRQPAAEPSYSKEFETQFNNVSGKLESLISSGVINDVAMENLQAEVGLLHPRDRRAVLSRLAKAINTGTVKLAH